MSVPAAARGSTTLSRRALRRVASGAAREALGTAGADGASARATAVRRRGRLRIGLSLALPYPLDLAAVTAGVQRQVAERTAALTGLRVKRVAVRVDRLTAETRSKTAEDGDSDR